MVRLLHSIGLVRAQALKIAYKGLQWLPRPLPTDPQALDALVHRVSVLNGYPTDDSARTAIATAILHLPMDKGSSVNTRAADGYFAALMRRSVTNQVAFAVVDAKRAAKLEASKANDAKAI